MPVSLDGQLVVAISSRALFDFEEENLVFEQSDDRAYMKLQLERLEEPAKPGVAFSLVKKLLVQRCANAACGGGHFVAQRPRLGHACVQICPALWLAHSAR